MNRYKFSTNEPPKQALKKINAMFSAGGFIIFDFRHVFFISLDNLEYIVAALIREHGVKTVKQKLRFYNTNSHINAVIKETFRKYG